MEPVRVINRDCDVICRYFANGFCRYGNRCRFRHEVFDDAPSRLGTTYAAEPTSVGFMNRNTEDFEPSNRSGEYLDVAAGTSFGSNLCENAVGARVSGFRMDEVDTKASSILCPLFLQTGYCNFLDGQCNYAHGYICEYCGFPAIHPYNEELKKKHLNECIQQHEVDMNYSFAVARSKDKTCGICFEVIVEKDKSMFGILPGCNHCFCLDCIRQWRLQRNYDTKIIRSCPECRISSDFVCPSPVWVDDANEKSKLIEYYKAGCLKKDCKYFRRGSGTCPFGNKCFYGHKLPDGTFKDVGPPRSRRREDEVLTEDHIQVILSLVQDYFNTYLFEDLSESD